MEKKYKLGELFFIRNGANIRQNKTPDGIPITRIETIADGYLDLEKVGYASIKDDSYRNYYLQKGDILMSHINSETHLGKVAFVEDLPYPVIHGMNLLCLKIREEILLPKYAFYYFRTFLFKTQLKKIIKHSVNQASFAISDLCNISIWVPNLVEQERVANTLEKADQLIQRRLESLQQLDYFVNSVFYQLFGDPVRNDKGWEIELLKDLCTKIGSGATPRGGKENYKREGISLIRSLNVYNGYFEYKDLAFIDDEQARALSNVIVEENDILFTITGASVARCCVVPKDILPARVNQHVAIIRVDKKKINSVFLNYTLINLNYQTLLIRLARQNGATREALTKEDIELLSIPLAPISLQNRFAEILQKVQTIKQRFQESLEELNNLYQSISQRAFQGKLNLSRLDVQEESEKFQREPDVSTKKSIENILLRDDTAFYDTYQVSKRKEKIEPVLSGVEESMSAYGVFNFEQVAEHIKARYKGYHFSFEMLYRYLQKTWDEVPYYSSEELKKRPELSGKYDIRWFIQAAIVNIERGENEKRLLNPFIRLKQHFYNAEEENMFLHIIDEDYELLQNRNKKERSGIYFSIVEP